MVIKVLSVFELLIRISDELNKSLLTIDLMTEAA